MMLQFANLIQTTQSRLTAVVVKIYPMYSKKHDLVSLLLQFAVDQNMVYACMNIFLHPVTVFLDLARAATTSQFFLPMVQKGRKPGCCPFFYYYRRLSTIIYLPKFRKKYLLQFIHHTRYLLITMVGKGAKLEVGGIHEI